MSRRNELDGAPESKTKISPRETWGFLRKIAPRIRVYRKAFVAILVLLPLSTAIGLAFPLLIGWLLDAAFVEGDAQLLNRIAVGLLGLFMFQALLNFAQSYLSASVSERVVADLRRDVFNHLVLQSPGFYADRRVGELTSRLSADAGLVQGVVRFGVPELARQGIFLVGALILLTLTHPRLTMVTLLAVPFAVIVAWLFGRPVRRLSTNIQDRLAEAVSQADQVFTQITTVQSYTREPWEMQRFGAHVDATRDQGLKRAVARAGLTGAMTFAASAAIVAIVWEGGRLVLAGALTSGTLVTFLLYVVAIAGAVTALAGFWANLQEAAGAVKRIFEILDYEPTLKEPARPMVPSAPPAGAVRYRDVRFRYGPDLAFVLDGIDIDVRPGEHVALVGSSGAGKTTLLSLLPRFYDVVEGCVELDGTDVREYRLADLRGAIGVVPQEPMLFAGSVAENLRYGNLDATDAELEAAAKAAHAHEFICGFPDGYQQEIGERGVTVSAGQRQRLAIARVVLKRPTVLILDEASASLDSESEALVQDALDRLQEGRTTLVIAHRLSTVLASDRILVLEDGRITGEGSHQDLLDRSETYARLYRRQFEQVRRA